MVKLDNVTEGVLDVINDNKFSQTGAFNLRENGTSICHGDSEHIKIKKKTDKPGIDIYIDGKTDGEAVYIPVVLSKSGMTDLVYNDFYVEDGADVRIVAGRSIAMIFKFFHIILIVIQHCAVLVNPGDTNTLHVNLRNFIYILF